jgi:hypothetical protein
MVTNEPHSEYALIAKCMARRELREIELKLEIFTIFYKLERSINLMLL